jgi:hypothetical protein
MRGLLVQPLDAEHLGRESRGGRAPDSLQAALKAEHQLLGFGCEVQCRPTSWSPPPNAATISVAAGRSVTTRIHASTRRLGR